MSVEALPRPQIKPMAVMRSEGPASRPETAEQAKPKSHEMALIGMGAGNLGLVMNLDAGRQLDSALRRGVGFYDAQPFGAGTLNIACSSNSDGRDFSDAASRNGIFSQVRSESSIDGVSRFIDLRQANTFYRGVGAQLEQTVGDYSSSDIVKRRVSHVTFDPEHIEPNKRFTLHSFNPETRQSEVVGYANKVVLGTGATQEISPAHEMRHDLQNKTLFTAEELLDGSEQNMDHLFDTLAELPPEKRKIGILGVSHGALATAAEILLREEVRVDNGQEPLLGEGAITLLGRNEPKVFAKDMDEANKIYGGAIDEGLIAPNGAYNRFGGVRANAKELLLQVQHGQENRVKVSIKPDTENIWEAPDLDDAPFVIQAFGPSVNLVPVYDTEGKVINTVDDRGNLVVGQKGNLETTYGEDIGLFSIGLGYPRKELSERMLEYAGPGENPAAVTAANAYATAIAEDVVEGLRLPKAA